MKRREFAKKALGAAVAGPILLRRLPQQPAQEPAKPEPRVKLTPEQEGAVKKATENRDRQLALMRNRVLPYDLEPAFVFAARAKERKKQGGKEASSPVTVRPGGKEATRFRRP
jgi:putative SOS response-associated peptidase YedK